MRKKWHRHLFLSVGSMLLLVPGGCTIAPMFVFLRNTSTKPVVVWIAGRGNKKNGVYKFPGLFQYGHYGNTLPYSSKLLRPTRGNISRMRDSLAVTSFADTVKFTMPAHSIVWLGIYSPLLGGEDFGLKLQRADSSIQTLNSDALAKAVHTRLLGGHRLWFDI